MLEDIENEEIELGPWEPCLDNHNWIIAVGWVGRYRCAECGSLGYKKHVLGGNIKRKPVVAIYVCPRCKGPTTRYSRKAQACPKCQQNQ